MPSNYDKIRQDNIRRRGEEFDDIGRLISEQLYADRSHFIYELLQNAEDALDRRFQENPLAKLPCSVNFMLFEDRLEFRHFGQLFNEADVTGVCDILKGTKHEDVTQIGKFGIGFKSVYAFTETPEIYSGDEHFVIERYIRPKAKEPCPNVAAGETLFVFPFNHKDLSRKDAFALILNKLKTLGPRVLLFLNRINEIEWSVECTEEKGQYLKESKSRGKARQVTVIGQNNGKDEEENWLIFERPVNLLDVGCQVRVEVGFLLATSTKDKTEYITRIKEAPVVVYFPTEKYTRFGFLMQGPYRTTPSRDNIKDDDRNKMLVAETSILIVDSLHYLKEMGLLSVSLLEAMPILMDDFWSNGMFYPLVTKVHDALMNEELLPTDDGTFVSAQKAKLAGAAWLRTLLRDTQLKKLFKTETNLKWISGEITEGAKNNLWQYLREKLGIEEVTPDSFARKIDALFLESQNDDWMISFYANLLHQTTLWRKSGRYWGDSSGPIRSKPFIRLQEGQHVTPFRNDDSPNAYLPVGPNTETSLPIVKCVLAEQEDARRFLKDLGIPELDIVAEVIEHILPKYSSPVSLEEHRHDIEKIVLAYKTDSQEKKQKLRERLLRTPFILTEIPGSENIEYRTPTETYFKTDDLNTYFSGNKQIGFVIANYAKSRLDVFKDLGVCDAVRVYKEAPNSKGFINIRDSHGSHIRGLNEFDPNIQVDGLKHAIASPSLEKSAFIWNHIAIPNCACIRGTVEKSTRQSYENCSRDDRISAFGLLLIEKPWLPGLDGVYVKPCELSLVDLPDLFIRNEKLADLLGMKKDVVAKLAEEAGISQETIELAQELGKHPELLAEFRQKIQPNASNEGQSLQEADLTALDYRNEFEQNFNRTGKKEIDDQIVDDGTVKDAERRRDKIYDGHRKRLESEPSADKRRKATIRTLLEGPDEQVREYLVQMYGGKCQICGNTFPERDGRPFFVANYIVPRKAARTVDTPANALCLCADHFAKWQHGAIESIDVLSQLQGYKTGIEGGDAKPALLITLCGQKCEIVFKEKHFLDLQELLRTSESIDK